MTRETLKFHPYVDGIREIVVRYDSSLSKVQVSNRTKLRIVIDIESLSSGILDASGQRMFTGSSDQESLEPKRVLPRPRFTMGSANGPETGPSPHGATKRSDSPE